MGLGGGAQQLPQRCRKARTVPHEGRRDRRAALTEADRRRQPRERLQPVAARGGGLVLRVALGVLGEHIGVTAEAAGRCQLAAHSGAVEFGDALVQQVAAVAVERNVVHAAVEKILPRRPQQDEAAGQFALQVERLADVGLRPIAYPAFGVGKRRHLQLRHRQRQFAGLEEHRLAVGHI